jgi:outer membrane protein OmpA-like peptidoglycan-associated protein
MEKWAGETVVWTRLRGAVAALAVAGLAGCSSVPDDLNPGTWASGASDWVSGLFSGSDSQPAADVPSAPQDQPKLGNDERPKPMPQAEKQQILDSLAADHANAHYTEAEQKRDGSPTRPLSGEAEAASSAPASDATAAEQPPAAASQPEPAKAAEPSPAPAATTETDTGPAAKTLKSSQPTSANETPAAPVQAAAAAPDTDSVVAPSARVKLDDPMPAPSNPPKPAPQAAVAQAAPAPAPAPKQTVAQSAPAPVTQPVATAAPAPAPAPHPVAKTGDLVADTYRQRLAEFRSGSVAASQATYREPAATPRRNTEVMNDAGMPNTKITPAHGSGGAHPLSALNQSKAAASFQMGEIAFGEGTAALGPDSEAHLKSVAEVYRSSKGTAKIGIVGHSNSRRLDVSASANRDANRSLAAERAAAVARALEKLGVPASKIYAGATGETAGDYVDVFVSY